MVPWNEPILRALASRTGHLPHALLIHGVRGLGKLALAERISQFLLCEASDASRRPCGKCEGCRWLAAGNHPDIRRLEPEAIARQPSAEAEDESSETPARRAKPSLEIKIEQVRGLADFLGIGSHRGRARVALVHPAENMNLHAASSLLKALEEPPAGAFFLLVSHRPSRLLPTIRSRCVSVPVTPPRREVALKWLAEQGIRGGDRWLAYAGGAPLQALEYANSGERLEKILRALADSNRNAIAATEDRQELEGLVDALQKVALDRAFAAFGLAPKYQTGAPAGTAGHAWLSYARYLGKERLLARHPLNGRLFLAGLLADMPK